MMRVVVSTGLSQAPLVLFNLGLPCIQQVGRDEPSRRLKRQGAS